VRVSTTTVYEGSQECECGRMLTPLEALYSRDGLCQTCHRRRVQTLITNKMTPET
jgi:hypothetical protein